MSKVHDSEVDDYMREIHRLVLIIYYRMTHCEDENENLAKKYECFKKILYEEWLIDIPKMLDICAIYGDSNPQIVMEIIKLPFLSFDDYNLDFKDAFDEMQKSILNKIYSDLMKIKSRDKLDLVVSEQEIMNKMELLTVATDFAVNINNIVEFFPKKLVRSVFANEAFN